MKHETITSAITATLAARTAEREHARQRAALLSAVDGYGDASAALERAIAARESRDASALSLKKLPPTRRALAADIVKRAEEIAFQVASYCGGSYSGETRNVIEWGTKAEACTTTTKGEQYSRGCTYKKTNANHWITLDPAGVALLVESEPLRRLSAADGLHLIALYPDDSAVWVRSKGKALVSERGWIVGNAAVCYHSTKSREHAQAGFAKKHAAHLAELRQRRLSDKQARRVRLITRLCGGITATLADAKALGYCEPGIRAFQDRYGIGNSATLPELVRTGDPAACRLTLSLARKVATV